MKLTCHRYFHFLNYKQVAVLTGCYTTAWDCRRETDAMDVSAGMSIRVSTNERLCQLRSDRKEKIFLLLFTVTALLCGALL